MIQINIPLAIAVQVFFEDGSKTEEIVVEYLIGYKNVAAKKRYPLLLEKFHKSLFDHFEKSQAEKIKIICSNRKKLENLPVNEFVDLLVIK